MTDPEPRDDSPEAKRERAEQRLERERQRAQRWRREERRRQRNTDTRRKILAGAWLLDVLHPVVGSEDSTAIADGIAAMIARQTQKKPATRQHEIEIFRAYFGDAWADRWKQRIEAGGE